MARAAASSRMEALVLVTWHNPVPDSSALDETSAALIARERSKDEARRARDRESRAVRKRRAELREWCFVPRGRRVVR